MQTCKFKGCNILYFVRDDKELTTDPKKLPMSGLEALKKGLFKAVVFDRNV